MYFSKNIKIKKWLVKKKPAPKMGQLANNNRGKHAKKSI
jgi:ribosomal protein L29